MSLPKLIALIGLLLGSQALVAGPKDYYPEHLLKESNSFEDDLYEYLKETHESGISYEEARRELFGNIHLKKNGSSYEVVDVYCNKRFTKSSGVGPGRIPNHQKINCEHTWPKSRFNPNESKAQQLTDLHHLYPTDSRANSTRKNYLFSMVDGDPLRNCSASKYGTARFNNYLAFEPPAKHRGNVARALFYFSVRYNIEIDDSEERYLRKWHKEDPVDSFERKRNNLVEDFQGNRNPFIDKPHWVNRVENF